MYQLIKFVGAIIFATFLIFVAFSAYSIVTDRKVCAYSSLEDEDKCNSGYVVMLNGTYRGYSAAKICNFDKQIVQIKDEDGEDVVLCVFK